VFTTCRQKQKNNSKNGVHKILNSVENRISLVMKGTTQYCLLGQDQIFGMLAVTQMRISAFPFSIKKDKGGKKS